MWIIRFAWKNLWRNRSRTLITISAIFFAVILSTLAESLKRGIFDHLVKNIVGYYTGYIQVHKLGYQDEQILDNSFPESIQTTSLIQAEKEIATYTPRLESFALASSNAVTKGCLVIGIDPTRENEVSSIQSRLVKGKYIQKEDHAVLIAEALAERLQLHVLDTIVLIGQGYHGTTAAAKYPIKGILRFGAPQLNDKMIYLPLLEAQSFFSADGMITSYILSLQQTKLLDPVAINLQQKIGNAYEVLTWEKLLPDIQQHIDSDNSNMRIVQGILYLIICFGIISTLMMMMMERQFEMGMLVAIGMQKYTLMLLFLAESVCTVIIGCIAGIAFSIPLIQYLHKYPIRIGGDTAAAYAKFGFEPIFPASTEKSIFITQFFIVLIIGLMLSLYPMMKVIRLQPVIALKK